MLKPAGAGVNGFVPAGASGSGAALPAGGGGRFSFSNLNARIFPCESVIDMLARRGRPSFEKNSSDSSSESIRPSNWNDPHRKRTAGGKGFSFPAGAEGPPPFFGV